MGILNNKASRIFMALVLVVGLMPSVAYGANEETTATSETFTAKQFTEAELQEQREQIESEGELDAYAEDEVLVVYEEGVPEALTASSIDSLAVSNVESVVDDMPGEGGETVLVKLDEGQSVADAVIAIEQQPGVAYAQPNYRYTLIDDIEEDGEVADSVSTTDESAVYSAETTSVNDPIANISTDLGKNSGNENQWWLYSVNAFDAWDYARCENSVTVAILDTGINFDHADLKNQIDTEHAWDAVEGAKLTENPTELFSHGSHVAGIVAGTANNGTGIAGVSYNAKILPIQVFQTSSSGTDVGTYDDTLIKAYEYLLDLKSGGELDDLHVINMSLGGYSTTEDTSFMNVISKAKESGIVTVCAGGNGDSNNNAKTTPHYPSDYEDCISVMALDSENTRAQWSDYNSNKDIIAPGVKIWSTWYTGNEYYCASGTSMASPLVAGVCALLYSVNPDLTVDEVKEALYNTATDLGGEGYDVYYGWGKVNAAAAVQYVAKAKVTSDETEIYRTESMQMTATPLSSATEVDSWKWSVDNPEVATIDANGVLTGITAGTVTVTAVASNDSEVFGSRKITVSEIEISGALNVSDKDISGVELSWATSRAAAGYDVLRANRKDGTYEKIASVSANTSDSAAYTNSGNSANAEASNSVTYIDSKAEANTVYYYKVQPYGMLSGARVEGLETDAVSGMYRNAITSIAGATRYDTNSAATSLYATNATYAGEKANTVIVASGKNFPDALSASSLAGVLNAPIVLSDSDELEEATADQIIEVMPRNIIIIGGEAAISTNVESELANLMPEAKITRVYGNTRIKTAEAIYNAGNGDWGSTAIITASTNYADALSVSAYAYATNSPILLAESDGTLSTVTRQRLKAGKFSRVIIVGGTAAVPEKTEKTIKALGIDCERWSGSTRFETSAVIAQNAVKEGALKWENVGFVSGENFPDGLSAGALQGQLGGVLLLVNDSDTSKEIISSNIGGNSKSINHISFYGGDAAVSQSLRSYITGAAGV